MCRTTEKSVVLIELPTFAWASWIPVWAGKSVLCGRPCMAWDNATASSWLLALTSTTCVVRQRPSSRISQLTSPALQVTLPASMAARAGALTMVTVTATVSMAASITVGTLCHESRPREKAERKHELTLPVGGVSCIANSLS